MMNNQQTTSSSPRPSPPSISAIAPLGDWSVFEPAWERFQREHAGWLHQFGGNGPLYALSRRAAEVLARGEPGRRAVISASSAAAETALWELCDRGNAVGVWQNQPINYPYLMPG